MIKVKELQIVSLEVFALQFAINSQSTAGQIRALFLRARRILLWQLACGRWWGVWCRIAGYWRQWCLLW